MFYTYVTITVQLDWKDVHISHVIFSSLFIFLTNLMFHNISQASSSETLLSHWYTGTLTFDETLIEAEVFIDVEIT